MEKVCETRDDISPSTKQNLQDIVNVWNWRLSERMYRHFRSNRTTQNRSEKPTFGVRWHTKSAPLAQEDEAGSQHVVRTQA
jgi:hypothetical protein